MNELSWPADGLLPAIVQHADSGEVLMLAYMNAEALALTRSTGRVTFYSRRRQRLWVKGETSGNFLAFETLASDCDGDALLVLARPHGPVCHVGTPTCWGDRPPLPAAAGLAFLTRLERLIGERDEARPTESYSARLLARGTPAVAQKVGEEAVELALAAVTDTDERVLEEAADLLYHTLVLLRTRRLTLGQVVAALERRHLARAN
jgi:phosphoribosyl-ATP pyrophosphohydrolase/phosphoribosyl-AMP cyclohydrolase